MRRSPGVVTRRSFPFRWLAAGLILVVGAVGYVVFVKQTHLDRSRLSQLVIVHPGVPGLKPKAAAEQEVNTERSTYPTVKTSGENDYNHTGAYARNWQGTAASHNAATLLVDLLPNEALAAKTRAEAARLDLAAGSFAAEHFTLSSHFTISGIPGSSGSAYAVAASSTSVAGNAYSIVFRVGRTVVSQLVEAGQGGLTQADAETIARNENSLLQRVEPGFTMEVTTRHFWPSLIYWVIVVVLAVLALVTPGLIRRRRAARLAKRAHREQYQYRSRGRKAVRRHRAPSWAHPRR
jgi:hypothetical protein